MLQTFIFIRFCVCVAWYWHRAPEFTMKCPRCYSYTGVTQCMWWWERALPRAQEQCGEWWGPGFFPGARSDANLWGPGFARIGASVWGLGRYDLVLSQARWGRCVGTRLFLVLTAAGICIFHHLQASSDADLWGPACSSSQTVKTEPEPCYQMSMRLAAHAMAHTKQPLPPTNFSLRQRLTCE
jgi:hypothetical protein